MRYAIARFDEKNKFPVQKHETQCKVVDIIKLMAYGLLFDLFLHDAFYGTGLSRAALPGLNHVLTWRLIDSDGLSR